MNSHLKSNVVDLSILKQRYPASYDLILRIADIGKKEDLSVYIVGGFVRDFLLGRATQDFDIVIEGDAIAFGRKLAKQIGGRLVSHKKFGTAKWNLHSIKDTVLLKHQLEKKYNFVGYPGHIDLITARQEEYSHPAALPTVKKGNIESDLFRRDFTINTLALRLDPSQTGELLDLFGGREDLRQGKIQILHDRSFTDDPSRQLRAVRFEQRFGFKIEPHTLDLMSKDQDYLGKITGIRLRHELDLLLKEEKWQAMFNRMTELGIFTSIHPQLSWKEDWAFPLQNALDIKWDSSWGKKPGIGRLDFNLGLAYIVWLFFFQYSARIAIEKRLNFPLSITKATDAADHLLRFIPKAESSSVSQITTELEKYSTETIVAISCLELDPKVKHIIQQYLNTWQHVKPELNGHDLHKMGIPKGPVYKNILHGLRAGLLDGELLSLEEEKKWVKDFLLKR